MAEEDKYKLALFAVIRNSQVMPLGLDLGKTIHEINRMSVETMEEVIKSCDFKRLEATYEDGITETAVSNS